MPQLEQQQRCRWFSGYYFKEVAIALGHVAAGIAALKGRQAVAYSASANLATAASRIEDTDFAKETANLAKNSVLNQSAMAMVAQQIKPKVLF